MIIKTNKNIERKSRHLRVRKKVSGTSETPRLNVYRSTSHIYAQIIDDVSGKTLVSASSSQKEQKGKKDTSKQDMSYAVGTALAQKAIKAGIKKVVFDRGGYIYTGRVKKLAEGARDAGLEF